MVLPRLLHTRKTPTMRVMCVYEWVLQQQNGAKKPTCSFKSVTLLHTQGFLLRSPTKMARINVRTDPKQANRKTKSAIAQKSLFPAFYCIALNLREGVLQANIYIMRSPSPFGLNAGSAAQLKWCSCTSFCIWSVQPAPLCIMGFLYTFTQTY